MPRFPETLRHAWLAFALALIAPAAGAAETASAAVVGPNGEAMGEAIFRQWPSGVLIELRLSGLEPGEHGVHIHETGACDGDFSSAGGHFNPAGRGHGFSTEEGAHAGDLPNIFAGADGAATAHILTDGVTLGEGPNSIFDADGSALIVHAKADTYAADAGAGGRVACGVVTPES